MTWRDTISKTFLGLANTISEDPADNLDNWISNEGWDLTDEEFVTAEFSITDSPDRRYFNNENSSLLSQPIDLNTGDAAFLSFYALWEIETDYDYVQVIALDEILNPIAPLCGLYTNGGVGGFQPEDEPLYDGEQLSWVEEKLDLSEYMGQTIVLQFVLRSDGGLRRDGFYMDDVALEVFEEGVINQTDIRFKPAGSLTVQPNPAQDMVEIRFNQAINGKQRLSIYNALGELVRSLDWKAAQTEVALDGLPSGVYFAVMEDGDESLKPVRFVKE